MGEKFPLPHVSSHVATAGLLKCPCDMQMDGKNVTHKSTYRNAIYAYVQK